ncbi:hypothetical protein ANO14919_131050 [Xylariales sp. No.14919]|nr:hypothetical protein ANO14919_131050 [Xylariales sp. No.14919]
MPPFIHEAFKEFVTRELECEMDRIADEYPDLADTRDKIFRLSRTPVRKHESRFNLSPDSQLRSEGGFRSHFFIEVGYGEGEGSLLSKTCDYCCAAPGCTVLSFSLDYAAPSTRRTEGYTHGGSFSLDTSIIDPEVPNRVIIEELVDAERFRGAGAGDAAPQNLEIPFELLVPAWRRGDLPASAAAASVRISVAELAQFLSMTDEHLRVVDERRQRTPEPGSPGLRNDAFTVVSRTLEIKVQIPEDHKVQLQLWSTAEEPAQTLKSRIRHAGVDTTTGLTPRTTICICKAITVLTPAAVALYRVDVLKYKVLRTIFNGVVSIDELATPV